MGEENPQENEKAIEQRKAELAEKLNSYHISLDQWGKGSAKTLDHLLEEIEAGETVLVEEQGELVRKLGFVGVIIYYEDGSGRYKLREEKQAFRDGRIRTRPHLEGSVSEKMKPGEAPLEAVQRGLAEELAMKVDPDNIKYLAEKKIVSDSPSYPGLNTHYFKYIFELTLPKERANPEGYVGEETDQTNYWRWLKQKQEE